MGLSGLSGLSGLAVSGGAAAWTPADRSTLVAWLKADAGTGGVADADAVTTWADQSGNDNSPTQATSNKRPLYKTGRINGLPSVLFDGSNDALVDAAFGGGAMTQPYTTAVVYRRINPGLGIDYMVNSGSGAEAVIFSPTANTTTKIGDEKLFAGNSQLVVQALNEDWHILVVEWNGANTTVRLDNKPKRVIGNVGTAAWTGLAMGAYNDGVFGPTNCEIAEVVVDSAPLGADEDSLIAYIDAKYGVLATADAYATVDTNEWNGFPGLCIAANGDILAAYRKATGHVGSKGSIYLARRTAGVWGTPVQILADATYDLRDPSGLTTLASGRIALPYFRYPVSGTPLTDIRGLYTYSDDGGATWASPVMLATPAGYDWVCFWGGIEECANGDLLAPGYGVNTATTFYDALLFKSVDDGANWTLHGVMGAGASGKEYSESAVRFTTDESNLIAVLRDDPGPDLHTTVSTDGGATWGAPVMLVGGAAPQLLRLADGDLLLAWAERDGPMGTSVLKSRDHGATWGGWQYRVWVRTTGDDAGYCGLAEISPGVVGVVSYLDSSATQSTIRWDTFRAASVQ